MQIGSTGELVENTTPYSAVGNQVNAANSLPPSITQTAPQADVSITHTGFTPVGSVKQSDDSIGRLKIPSLDVNIKVYDAVYSVRQVKETDTSCLAASTDNMITLVTCVRDVRENRWCVQAKEV